MTDHLGQQVTPQRARAESKPSLDWRPAFLSALETTGVVKKAAEAAEISRMQVWREKQSNPQFAKDYDERLYAGALLLEAEAIRRASEGCIRKKFTKGGAPIIDPATGEQYVEHEYSDPLLLALLKRNFPEYRDKATAETHVTTHTNNFLVLTPDVVTQLQERRKQLLARVTRE